MNELIKIIDHNGKQAVSARELHRFLEITERFSNWFERMLQYGFTESVDYQGCEFFNTLANQTLTDYALALDCAKEISMIQRSEKGKQARRYFIECENRLKQVSQYQIPQSYSDALKLAYEQSLTIETQNKLLEDQKPKVLFTDAVMGSSSSCLIGELAKLITQNGYEIGEKRLFKWLRDHHFLGKTGERYNIPMQKYIEQGLFELKKGTRSGNGGVMHTTVTPKVTGKGQVYFVNKFLKRELQIA